MGNSPSSSRSKKEKKMFQGGRVCGSEPPTSVEIFSSCDGTLLNNVSLKNGVAIFDAAVNGTVSPLSHNSKNISELQQSVQKSRCDVDSHCMENDIFVEDKFCSVCLKVVPKDLFLEHCVSEAHEQVKKDLLADAYPYSCENCEMRFSTELEYVDHLPLHSTGSNSKTTFIKFNLFFCFLCRVSFKNSSDLQEHHKSSTAHAFRLKLGEEFATRGRVAAADDHDSKMKGDGLALNLNPEERRYQNNPSISNGSDSKISMYYCGPCSSYVSKINVLLHESSENHRQCCYAWVRGSVGFSQGNQEILTPIHSSELLEIHEGYESDSQPKVDTRANVAEQFLEVFKKYLSLEKCVRLEGNGNYFCSPCKSHNSIYKMMTHVISLAHLHKCAANRQSLSVLEEKEKILKHMLEVKSMVKFGKSGPRNLRTIMNSAYFNVSKPLGKHCISVQKESSKTGSVSRQPYNQREEICRESEGSITPSPDISNEKENVISSIILDNGTKSSISSYPERKEGEIVTLVSGNSGSKTIRSDEIVTEKEINEAIDEYFSLEEVSSLDVLGHLYKCSLCNVQHFKKYMFSHILSKHHMNSSWAKRQTPLTVNGKLELLAFFQLLENQKWEVLSSCSVGSFTGAMAQLKVLKKLGNDDETVNHTLKSGLPTQTPLLGPSLEKVNSTHPESVIQGKCNSLRAEESASTDIQKCNDSSVIIGGSESVKLQEEIDQLCADNDIDDFEFECETCGSGFPIFNGDLVLSMEMHVQNPVHSLATAVPVERNAVSVAVMAKDSNTLNSPALSLATAVPVKRKAVSFGEMAKDTSTLNSAQTHKNSVKALPFCERRRIVISEVFLLEQNYVVEQNGFWCKFCEVQLRTNIQMFHHLISSDHLNEEWSNNQTHEVLQQKSKTISSLMTYGYAIRALGNAAFWINQQSLAKRRGFSQSNETRRVNSMVIKPSSSVSGTKHTLNKPNKICKICNEDLSDLSKNMVKQHRREHSGTFFCEVCKIKMNVGSKVSHLSGKSHKSKITSVLENLASSLSSLQFESGFENANESL